MEEKLHSVTQSLSLSENLTHLTSFLSSDKFGWHCEKKNSHSFNLGRSENQCNFPAKLREFSFFATAYRTKEITYGAVSRLVTCGNKRLF